MQCDPVSTPTEPAGPAADGKGVAAAGCRHLDMGTLPVPSGNGHDLLQLVVASGSERSVDPPRQGRRAGLHQRSQCGGQRPSPPRLLNGLSRGTRTAPPREKGTSRCSCCVLDGEIHRERVAFSNGSCRAPKLAGIFQHKPFESAEHINAAAQWPCPAAQRVACFRHVGSVRR